MCNKCFITFLMLLRLYFGKHIIDWLWLANTKAGCCNLRRLHGHWASALWINRMWHVRTWYCVPALLLINCDMICERNILILSSRNFCEWVNKHVSCCYFLSLNLPIIFCIKIYLDYFIKRSHLLLFNQTLVPPPVTERLGLISKKQPQL